MDEGKPTKAKWWSRPRPNSGGPTDDGDWHLPAPQPTGVEEPGARGVRPADAADAGGPDREVPPAATPDTVVGHGDGVPEDPARSADVPDATPATYELAPPSPTEPAPGAAPAASASGTEPTARAADAASGTTPATPVAPMAPEAPQEATSPAAPVHDAPRPLHDPDPYSTPPYGEPGPWAPAPPVQHPATTPPHGTASPFAAQHGTYPVTPGETLEPAPEQPYPTGAPQPAPEQPYPSVAAPQPMPEQPYPSVVPQPAPEPPYPSVAAPQPMPEQSYPTGGQQPAPEQSYPTGAQQPAPEQSYPYSVPQPAPEQPYASEAPPHSAPDHPYPGPQDPYSHAAPAPGGPWQRYDPWAGPVGLSGGGGLVGERPRRPRRAVVIGAVLIAVVSGVVGGALGSYLERNGGADVKLPQAGAESAHRDPGSVAGIAASALPGVVTIHTKGSSEEGTGTGFVLDGRGHILTNNHVVQPAGSSGRISVTFAGGESADADVVGHDSGYDLAVIKVSGVRGLKPLSLGNSENVQVGDPVVAIGAPFDLANTVTSGIISAKDRPITAGGEKGDGTDVSYVDALQTDAPINPGNSGGPLVDSKARVIGINSAIRSADSGSELDGGQSGSIGLGFAIPINQAKRVAEELINTGKATHPVIGVTLDMDYSGDGARVGTKGNDGGSAVSPGGPGAKAGIEPGDVITEVDGVRVHTGEELIVKIRAHRPEDELDLTVERDGKERKVTLVLGSADGD
ncbi:trypsin-like peptidase domain-containing protein [Streptomyces sp. NPDC016845]|uniref:S1C family serine protease n=1 Tax=Streptomyces sp. NPDC016845 TaxID=3364972 RepID=UPI003787585A